MKKLLCAFLGICLIVAITLLYIMSAEIAFWVVLLIGAFVIACVALNKAERKSAHSHRYKNRRV